MDEDEQDGAGFIEPRCRTVRIRPGGMNGGGMMGGHTTRAALARAAARLQVGRVWGIRFRRVRWLGYESAQKMIACTPSRIVTMVAVAPADPFTHLPLGIL